MYVQVVTYGLAGISESEYLTVANQTAPRFALVPGLQAKIWLEDAEGGLYGAIYLWDDRESMERFVRSDLFEATNPDFEDITSEGFGVLENLTAQTQPVLEIVVPPREPAPPRRPTKAPPKKAPAAGKAAGGGARKVPVTTKAATKAAPAKKAAVKKGAAKKGAAKQPAAKKATAKKVAPKKVGRKAVR